MHNDVTGVFHDYPLNKIKSEIHENNHQKYDGDYSKTVVIPLAQYIQILCCQLWEFIIVNPSNVTLYIEQLIIFFYNLPNARCCQINLNVSVANISIFCSVI